ncbi:MAG: ABC transporter ATP-binding protein [Clostridia bacterium]|nr:ABC transporter ATP-binding protein [Clostridia bacterium]
MIEAHELRKGYDGEYVLENLTMHVKKGSIYGIIGSNGAGKSTLLNVLSGVFKPDYGRAEIDGEEVFENNRVKGLTAYITDDPFYFNSATVREMARFLNKMYDSFSMEKFEKTAALFPIDVDKKLSGFSKGMKRQAAIVLAIAQMPEVLLCDECFDGLDPVVRQLVKGLFISEVAERDMTIVISSHNLREMESLCDTIGILHEKKIVTERSVGDIKDSMHRYSVAYKPMIDVELLKQKLDVVSLKQRGNILEIVVRGAAEDAERIFEEQNPILIDEMPLTLEDIFICEMEVKGYDFSKILL